MPRAHRAPAVARHRQFVNNPEASAWVQKTIGDAYERMQELVPAQYLPRLTAVSSLGGSFIAGRADTYGCGTYGCVYPTLDPKVVLKVTSDDTEADFAHRYANHLVAPICVRYHAVLQLEEEYRGSPIYLLWRESASSVGAIESELGEAASELVDRQWTAGATVYQKLADGADATWEIQEWLGHCAAMRDQTQLPDLQSLGAGLIEVWEAQHIFFGDIHTGNLGQVERPTGTPWVITDPGHIAVINP